MQNWILDRDLDKSASYLDKNRLQSNIYENIHGLASILGVNNKLVTPKRSVINHPNIKRWIGFEREYLFYIHEHLWNWFGRNYSSIINFENYKMLLGILKECSKKTPEWITDGLIKKHQQILLEKDYEHYSKFFIKD